MVERDDGSFEVGHQTLSVQVVADTMTDALKVAHRRFRKINEFEEWDWAWTESCQLLL